MIKAEWFFWLVGGIFLVMAAQMLADRTNPKRHGTAAFWGLLGLGFVYSTWVADKSAPAEPLGAAVLAMVGLAGFGFTGRGAARTAAPEQRAASAERFGSRLFVPALTIPLVALVCAVGVKRLSVGGEPVLQKGNETILGLGIGAVVALAVGMVMLREKRISVPLHAGRSTLESMGWVMLLPQLLATLGAIFSVAGVGEQVRRIATSVLPGHSVFPAVVVYCVGMFLFTAVMGNGFAAFPVMTAAVGWPVLIEQAHGNAAGVLAVGMLAGFCGTLVTPMAANYNLAPAALLELRDQYGPIKAQLPTALALLGCNIAIMSLFAV
ncbi:putative membrane protein [Streptomyces olivoverticillatus]|uniref:Putative membrane protein n=1 Tax=Streptomyces olivoverticillatus TaxID=66427 RepID=A0A7W7LSM0_9ACTN|nr:putative membrane protein [Streptomyces olivoverticillatus]